MLTMDVFNQDAFSAVSLSAAIDKMDYVPNFLDSLPGLFEPDPVRTEVVWIEDRDFSPVILPFSPRGAAPHQVSGDKRTARAFRTLRFGDASRVTASELLAIRAFGSEVDLKDVASEIARRQMKMKQNFALTREYHKFNAVTGAVVKDSDGSTLINWATEFGQSIPSEVDFDLDNASPAEGAVRKKCTAARRSMQIGLKSVGWRAISSACAATLSGTLPATPRS